LKTLISDLKSWKKRVEVEVPFQEVRPHLDSVYRKYQKKIRVDGFRKGKVPISIIQKQFGKAIQGEVADDLVQVFFKKAVEQEKLAIVSPGSVQKVSFEEDKPLTFTVEVEVKPEIKISNYKGFKVEKTILKVTDSDVKNTIDILREQKADEKPAGKGAESGFIVKGDVQSLDATGVPMIGKKWEDRIVEMGKPPLGDLIQDQLLGVIPGEERRFKIVQQEMGPDQKMRDREDHYSITVKSVTEKILPEPDDKFAQQMGEFKTFSELEGDIENRLKKQRDEEAEHLLKNRLIDEIIKRNTFELPPSMVNYSLDRLWKEYSKQPDSDVTEEQFQEENRTGVVGNLKWQMVWPKIAEIEDIEVTQEEVDAEIDKMVEAATKNKKRIYSLFKDPERRNGLIDNMKEEKVIQFLKDNVKIKNVTLKAPKEQQSSIVSH